MSEEKKDVLRERLFYTQKQGYDLIDLEERLKLEAYCEDYKAFLDASRTEREAVCEGIRQAEEAGFVPYVRGMELKAGDKVYQSVRGKALMLAVIGKKSLAEGANIAAAHVDSPRLDLKQLPLYEDGELAYLKTHYYGGIKKYQWLTIPLELHGVVTRKDGETIPVVIGKDPEDPKFVITDLLPHLGKDQMSKSAADVVSGENLSLLVGSIPYADEGKDRVKLAILSMLCDRYGITEEDFLSAELEAVPSLDTCDVGLDRSLIGGYGHDDRVCAYPAMEALLTLDVPEHTCLTVLADKEEIGSDGNTGLNSSFMKYFIEDLADMQGAKARHVLHNSDCLSADVTAAFDPSFPQVYDKTNTSFVNHGVSIAKYTGARGKGGASDANAEYVGKIRAILDSANVHWQIGEMGKVDEGGGGTVALYIANLDVNVVDLGVPVLSMHAPFEVVSKTDVYSTFKACEAFYKS